MGDDMEKEIKVLQTWGEIEEYLGLSKKTILDHGYPVRTGPRGGRFALSDELDDYRRSMPVRRSKQKEINDERRRRSTHS